MPIVALFFCPHIKKPLHFFQTFTITIVRAYISIGSNIRQMKKKNRLNLFWSISKSDCFKYTIFRISKCGTSKFRQYAKFK